MKSAFAILVISSFVGLAVFGILAPMHETGHGICFAVAATGGKPPCPIQDPLGFANFHIDIFKSFSTAAFANSLTLAALSAVLLLMLAASLPEFAPPFFEKLSFAFLYAPGYSPEKIAARKTLHWLSLHESHPDQF
ncbi:MAG: hypothetical protein WAP51_02065 [Candidatus Sungiibacteriota bacterium]